MTEVDGEPAPSALGAGGAPPEQSSPPPPTSEAPRGSGRRIDALVLVLAASIAAATDVRSFAGLLAAYGAAWLGVELALRTRAASALRSAPWWTVVALGLVPAVVLARRAPSLVASEGLRGVEARLTDRARLTSELAIDPALLRLDRPQALIVRSEGAREVTLVIGEQRIAGRPLGAGAFVLDVDPQGWALEGTSVEGRLLVDGVAYVRRLRLVAPAPHPRALVASEDGGAACAVSEETDELLLVDRDGTRRLSVGDRPVACGMAVEGVWVAHRGGEVRRIGAGAEATRHVPLAVTAMAVASDTQAVIGRLPTAEERLASALVVLDGGTRELDGIADHVVLTGATPSAPSHAVVALRAPARLVLVALSDMRIVVERRLRMPATALAARGERVVMASTDFAEDGAPHVGNHFVDDQVIELSAHDLSVTAVVHTAGRTPAQDRAGDVDVGAGPTGLSIDEDGAIVVAFTGTRDVARYRRLDAMPERLSLRGRDDDDHAPASAVRLGDGTWVIASPASGAVVRALGDDIEVDRLGGSGAELLRRDPEALRARMGELAFGEATRSGVSCASCHPGGESDHEGHNIGGRVRAPTLPVLGVAGTAPYLRDGSYPRLRDLHEVSIEEYRGYRYGAGDRGATIEGWIGEASRPPIHVSVDDAVVARGAEVFVRAECIHCHVPPAFTDLSSHPVSAVFPEHVPSRDVVALDTPSLRGLSESAPYLYDGRAATLRAVITEHNGGERHGHTAALSGGDVDALIAFLRAIP